MAATAGGVVSTSAGNARTTFVSAGMMEDQVVPVGGIIVGALGCVYAPQFSRKIRNMPISKALAGENRSELMSRLLIFSHDDEKALERTRKILSKKIEQLNSAIDEVSAQLRADDPPNGSAVRTGKIEAAI